MVETLEDVIRERPFSKYPDSSDGSDTLKRRSAQAHVTVRLWVRRGGLQPEDATGGYANETYDVVVTKAGWRGRGGGGSENPDHLDADITSETYRHGK